MLNTFYKFDKLLLVLIILFLALTVFNPFINTLILVYFSAFLLQPVYLLINKKLKNKTLNISFLMLLVICLIVLPLVFSTILIYQEIVNFNPEDVFGYSGFSLNDYLTNTAAQITVQTPFNINSSDLINSIYNLVTSLPQFLFKNAVSIGNQIALILTDIIIYLLLLPIFILNSSKVDEIIVSLIPLNDSKFKIKLLTNIKELFTSIFKGTVLTGIIQSGISYLYFIILDIPNSLLLAFLVFLSSLIPNASFVIYLIISIFYIINNSLFMAIFNLLFFAIIIASVDNVVRPFITRKNVKINPIIMILAILGGLSYFGFLGIFYGPILLLVIVELTNKIRTDNEIDNI